MPDNPALLPGARAAEAPADPAPGTSAPRARGPRIRAAPAGVENAQRLLRAAPEKLDLRPYLAQLRAWAAARLAVHPMGRRSGYPLKPIAVPPALWAGDPDRGRDVARGRLASAGLVLDTHTRSFASASGSADALAWLHGCSWLADLAAAHDTVGGAPIAERLIKLWLADSRLLPALAWAPEVAAERLMHWLWQAPLLLSSTDQVYRSAVLTALARFARHLHGTADKAADGLPRITTASALALAGLMLPGRENSESRAAGLLTAALDRHVLPDGGFSSRSPEDLHCVLRLLLSVRAAYLARGAAPPSSLLGAIDRAVPALKGLLLGDGALSSLNGGGPLVPAQVEDTLRQSQVNAKPLRNGAHSGFQRIEGGRAVLLLDAGPPPSGPSARSAHAGTLAFEFSDGGQRLLVNCGGDGARPSPVSPALRRALRHTAAHTTLTLAGQDSTLIGANHLLSKGVSEVSATRQQNEQGAWLDAAHDGYTARFGLRHRRRLFLKADGMDLRGEDRLEPVRGGRLGGPHRADIRFHLAAGVTAVATQGGSGVALKIPGGAAWMFRARGALLALEDSVSLTAGGVRKTQQIVLSAAAPPDGLVVIWSLRRSR